MSTITFVLLRGASTPEHRRAGCCRVQRGEEGEGNAPGAAVRRLCAHNPLSTHAHVDTQLVALFSANAFLGLWAKMRSSSHIAALLAT